MVHRRSITKYMYVHIVISNEPGNSIPDNIASSPYEDFDQPAHRRSLIRNFAGHSMISQIAKSDAQADLFAGRRCNLVGKAVPRLNLHVPSSRSKNTHKIMIISPIKFTCTDFKEILLIWTLCNMYIVLRILSVLFRSIKIVISVFFIAIVLYH